MNMFYCNSSDVVYNQFILLVLAFLYLLWARAVSWRKLQICRRKRISLVIFSKVSNFYKYCSIFILPEIGHLQIKTT